MVNGYEVKVAQVQTQVYMHLVYGAVVLVYAIVLSVGLTHWAESELAPALNTESEPSSPGGTRKTNYATAAMWMACCAPCLLLAGVSIPVMHVVRDGTLGRLMQDTAGLDLSVVTVVTSMLTDETLSKQALIRIIGFSVAILTILIPFFEMVLLALSLAFARARQCKNSCFLRVSHWCKVRAEILASFDCIDVFLLMGLVVLSDIDKFVVATTVEECSDLKVLMEDEEKLNSYGLGFAYADGRCINVYSHLRMGWFVLLGAPVLRSGAWRYGGLE
jgi:hypothetical protein